MVIKKEEPRPTFSKLLDSKKTVSQIPHSRLNRQTLNKGQESRKTLKEPLINITLLTVALK